MNSMTHSAKHASTTLTLVETPTQTTCPAWCAKHDNDSDVCIGSHIDLDFSSAGRIHSDGYAALGTAPGETTDITVYFSGLGAAYMGLEDAEKLAIALLGLIGTARCGGAR